MAKDKKTKPSKELPLGFLDREEKVLKFRDLIISKIKEIMTVYGFQYLETPSFEYSESIGKFLPDKERPDEGIFSFKDENRWLSLRYDLTAPLARYVAKNFMEIPKPFKRYQLGTVWRNEKPGPGRYREFLQLDADFVGTKNLMADAELLLMATEILKSCGLKDNEFKIKFSSRLFLNEILADVKDDSVKLKVLRSLDKIERLGINEVKKLLGKGRKDESGDFTQGASLPDKQIDFILKQVKNPSFINVSKNIKGSAYSQINEFKKCLELFNLKNIEFDPSIVRGLEYYTGIIFEINLNFEVTNYDGKNIKFGSIGGGGRYDNLINNFGDYNLPATGLSIGLDRLVYALMQKQSLQIKENKPVVICVFDNRQFKEYIKIVKLLREANINSEIYSGEGKLKKQMEYANKLRSPAVILYGDDEIRSGKATLKNLETGNESSVKIEDLPNEIKKII